MADEQELSITVTPKDTLKVESPPASYSVRFSPTRLRPRALPPPDGAADLQPPQPAADSHVSQGAKPLLSVDNGFGIQKEDLADYIEHSACL